jgi:hypothetical protein
MIEPVTTTTTIETNETPPAKDLDIDLFPHSVDPDPTTSTSTPPIDPIYDIVTEATNHFTRILSTTEIKEKYKDLYWGGNGVGDRWAKKKFNYTVVYAKKRPALYSENDNDEIPTDILTAFLQSHKKGVGIIGIFVHSERTNIQKRPIDKDIHKEITSLTCVICGTHNTICDHKNDLYNDVRVLNIKTQLINDFQPLCNHCNLQKRQVCKTEEQTEKLYSAKNIQRYKIYPFEFPWEKKAFDKDDIYCKTGTYWFDPVEFDRNIYYYSVNVIPIVNEIHRKIKSNQMRKYE